MVALSVNLPFGIYLAALICFGVSFLLKNGKGLATAGRVLLALGWIAQTALIGWRWMEGGRAPMSNQFESMLVLAWSVMLIYFILMWKSKLGDLGFWVSGLCLLIFATASFLDRSIEPLVPALQSNWLLYHVAVVMIGYAALGVAAFGGAGYLFLNSRKPATVDSGQAERAQDLDEFIYRAMTLGFILGAVWANEAWGSYWSWDPKETWSLITWLVYAVALHLRRSLNWTGTRFAWIALVGFLFVLFTYFGVNYLLSGLHSYA